MTNAKFSSLVAALTARASITEGAAKDLARVLDVTNLQYGFTESTMVEGEKCGIDWEVVWSLPQKQIFRTTQFINALVSGNRLHLDYTHARILCAMRLAGSYDLTTDAVQHLAAGTHSAAVNTRGVTSGAVSRMFTQSHKMNTVKTKVSNMTGVNGWSQVCGLTFADPRKQNHTISLNLDHEISKRFFALIDASTVGQIDAMNEKGIK